MHKILTRNNIRGTCERRIRSTVCQKRGKLPNILSKKWKRGWVLETSGPGAPFGMKRTSSFTCFDKNSNHPIACICPDSPASVALNFKLWMRLAHPNALIGKFPVTTKYSRTYYRGKASLRTSSAFNFLRSKPGSKQGSSEAPVVSLKVLRIQIFRLFPRLFSSDAFSKKHCNCHQE